MNEAIRKAMQRRMDAAMTSTLYGTANAAPQEPLTLAKLQKLMASMPPRETWLSSRLFPEDSAITVTGANNERFTCAGPGFWMRAADRLRGREEVTRYAVGLGNPFLGMNLTPIEIDADPEDSEERAEWKAGEWKRLREAFEVAMVPLPDWLSRKR